MAKLADALDLGSSSERSAGSTPVIPSLSTEQGARSKEHGAGKANFLTSRSPLHAPCFPRAPTPNRSNNRRLRHTGVDLLAPICYILTLPLRRRPTSGQILIQQPAGWHGVCTLFPTVALRPRFWGRNRGRLPCETNLLPKLCLGSRRPSWPPGARFDWRWNPKQRSHRESGRTPSPVSDANALGANAGQEQLHGQPIFALTVGVLAGTCGGIFYRELGMALAGLLGY